MHVRQIERTELNGMILRHTQSTPEILYKGCVICFLSFDGDIKGVGTRVADLNADEFQTFKALISMIEFEGDDKPDYGEVAKQAMIRIKETAERVLDDFDEWCGVQNWDLDSIRKNLLDIELINAKKNQYE